jgi:hypothetical protein
MISNPQNGWCTFKLGDFNNWYIKGIGSVLFHDIDGGNFILVLSDYVYIINEREERKLYCFDTITVKELAKELVSDIEGNIDGWFDEFLFEEHRDKYSNRFEKSIFIEMLSTLKEKLDEKRWKRIRIEQ